MKVVSEDAVLMREFTTDEKGRIILGTEYAEEDFMVAVEPANQSGGDT